MKSWFKKRKFLLLDVVLLLLIFLLVFYLLFELRYDGKTYPNIYLNDKNLSGLSLLELDAFLKQEIQYFDDRGLEIISEHGDIVWRRELVAFDPDLSKQLVVYNTKLTANKVYNLGRSGNLFQDIWFKASSFFVEREIVLDFLVNEEKIKENLLFALDDSLQKPQDAYLFSNKKDMEDEVLFIREEFRDENEEIEELVISDDDIVFQVEEELSGQEINYTKFFTEFQQRLQFLDDAKIELEFIDKKPQVSKEELLPLIDEAYSLLDLAPFNLKYQKDQDEILEFTVGPGLFSTWIEASNNNGDFLLSLDYEEVLKYFENSLITSVNVEPVKPEFEIEDGKVDLFFSGKDGVKLDESHSFNNILQAFLSKDMSSIFIETEIDEIAKVGDINDMGIQDLLGTGHSSFAGSPNNRVHNIKVGAEKFHGLIIEPGAEFSFLQNLGPVTQSAGYLPELVIKGNRTIPEYGGGLCQVSTTMFRTVLEAGLPVTARRNHSYRVSYYEPAGTDATIYNPSPDFRFLNDTGNNILIQARVEGTDIYFDFWGTSDGRIASTKDPVIYNIIRPGPTQIIETSDLKPGERKCTERAISGADAYWDYTVVYNPGTPDENIVETRFTSKYVPWREVCLVGVAPAEEKDEAVEEGVQVEE